MNSPNRLSTFVIGFGAGLAATFGYSYFIFKASTPFLVVALVGLLLFLAGMVMLRPEF